MSLDSKLRFISEDLLLSPRMSFSELTGENELTRDNWEKVIRALYDKVDILNRKLKPNGESYTKDELNGLSEKMQISEELAMKKPEAWQRYEKQSIMTP